MRTHVTTSQQVIDELGGPKKVGLMFATPIDMRIVGNWGTRGLPAKAWLVLHQALRLRGILVEPELFGMLMPAGHVSKPRRGRNGKRK